MSKIVHRAIKIRIYPSEAQKESLKQHFGCARFLYNFFLAARIADNKLDRHKKRKEFYRKQKNECFQGPVELERNFFTEGVEFTKLRKSQNFSFLRNVNSQAMRESLADLDAAFKRFFSLKSRFPRFKSKHRSKASISLRHKSKVGIKNGKLKFEGFRGGFKINKKHLKILKNITIDAITVSLASCGKYYAAIRFKEMVKNLPKTGKAIGVDVGITDVAVTSAGEKHPNHKFTKKYEKKLSRAQKILSRRVKGSRRWENQRTAVAKIYAKISNSRKDVLHKISKEIVKNYDFIAVETLKVKNMIKNKTLSKSISDASWGTLMKMLKYKCDWYGKTFVAIDQFFPSSQICFACGNRRKKEDGLKDLKVRQWECINCGCIHDRDVNAARNILEEATRIHESEAGGTPVRGGDVRPEETSCFLRQPRRSAKLICNYQFIDCCD